MTRYPGLNPQQQDDEHEHVESTHRVAALFVWLASVLIITCVIVLATATMSRAGGSDGPTPYTVTATGITFPTPLTAHGHVNVRLTDGRTFGLHLDPNNGHPGGRWIGATSLPWSAFGITSGCVKWVQWSGANEHYGEGGQLPVCLTAPTPTKEPTPCPTPTPTGSPTPVPTPSSEPTSEPTATPSSSPTSSPEPTPDPTSTTPPSPTPTPGNTETSTPSASPTPPPSDAPADPASPTSPPAPPTDDVAEVADAWDDRPGTLAATGSDPVAIVIAAVALILVGVQAVRLVRDERKRRGQNR